MGCTCSKRLDNEAAANPLQQLQAAEAPSSRAQQRRSRQEEKRQRQLAKLQKRNARKRRHQRVDSRSRGTVSGSLRHRLRGSGGNASGSGSIGRAQGSKLNLAPQLRLLGGSNGSSATECVSALYARTLEKQREEHQRTVELKTRHQLERQLDTFLLNQLLVGVQFFGHFEHELAAIDEQFQARQRACSQTMSEHSLMQANAIDAAVARRVLFKPR